MDWPESIGFGEAESVAVGGALTVAELEQANVCEFPPEVIVTEPDLAPEVA